MEKEPLIIFPDPADRLLTAKEVAERLGTDRNLVKDILDLGILDCLYFGNHRKVSAFDLNDFIVRFKGADVRKYVLGIKKAREGEKQHEGH